MLEIRAEQRQKKCINPEINILKSAIIKLFAVWLLEKQIHISVNKPKVSPLNRVLKRVDTVISISDSTTIKTDIFNTSHINANTLHI